MQGKSRSQKPKLELGLEGVMTKKMLSRVSKVVEEVNININGCLNIQPVASPLVEELEVHPQIEEDDLPSNLSVETLRRTNIV